ncbi:hypothetical protein D9M68_770300 [compost metagenome]
MNMGASMMAKVTDNSVNINNTATSIAGPLCPIKPTVVVMVLGSLPLSTAFIDSVMELSSEVIPRLRSTSVVMSVPSATACEIRFLKSLTQSTITGEFAATRPTSDKIKTILPV